MGLVNQLSVNVPVNAIYTNYKPYNKHVSRQNLKLDCNLSMMWKIMHSNDWTQQRLQSVLTICNVTKQT